VVAAAIVFAVLVIAGVVLVVSQRTGLIDQLDDALEAESERLATAIAAGEALPSLGDDDDRLVAVIVGEDVVAGNCGDRRR
jgi:hypothetical protein